MTPHVHGGLLVVLVAFSLGVVAGNLALLAVVRSGRLRAAEERLAPGELARLVAFSLAAPLISAVVVVAATLWVPAAALAFPELDHCASAMNAPHVCFVHGTWAFDSPWEALGVGVLAAALGAALVVQLVRLARARRVAATLLVDETAGPVTWTDDETPFAFAVGLLRPRVIVSAGLRRSLTGDQLEAALAHERAHARRGHALVRSAARVVGCFTLPSLRRRFVDLLVLAQELEADEDAAAVVGSRTLVAETLLRCVRLSRASFPDGVSPALTGSAFERRVESLCRPPRRGTSTRALFVGSLVAVAVVVFARAPLHRASESVAGVLFSSAVHVHHEPPFLDGAE